MLAQFEEENLLSESCNGTESDNEYNYNSTLPPLISETEMNAMPLGNESYAKPMSMHMLENIRDGSLYFPRINRRAARYKIRCRFKSR